MPERKRTKKQPGTGYDTGYCKPPVEHQFKPGQKPQPRRPKGPEPERSLTEYIAEELKRPMRIVENGVEQMVPVGRALAKAAIAGAIADRDPRRLRGFLPPPSAAEDSEFSDLDLAIVGRFLAQMQKQNAHEDGDAARPGCADREGEQ